MGFECTICEENLDAMGPTYNGNDASDVQYVGERNSASPIIALKCGHVFHQACINEWFTKKEKRECSNCRATSLVTDDRRIYINNTREDDADDAVVNNAHTSKIIDRINKEHEDYLNQFQERIYQLEDELQINKIQLESAQKQIENLEQREREQENAKDISQQLLQFKVKN